MPNEPMTEERITEIRGRENAATPGPWRDECVIGRRKEIETFHTIRDKDGAIVDVLPISAYHDAAFIAHAREDIPALLDEVERLRAENEKFKEAFWESIKVAKRIVTIQYEKEMQNIHEFSLRYAMEHNKK